MRLMQRLARLERDNAAANTKPCPICGSLGPVRIYREVVGQDGVIRLFDVNTGAELTGRTDVAPCPCGKTPPVEIWLPYNERHHLPAGGEADKHGEEP